MHGFTAVQIIDVAALVAVGAYGGNSDLDTVVGGYEKSFPAPDIPDATRPETTKVIHEIASAVLSTDVTAD